MAVINKGFPLAENLKKINSLLETHIKELIGGLTLFNGINKAVEYEIEDIKSSKERLIDIKQNLISLLRMKVIPKNKKI